MELEVDGGMKHKAGGRGTIEQPELIAANPRE